MRPLTPRRTSMPSARPRRAMSRWSGECSAAAASGRDQAPSRFQARSSCALLQRRRLNRRRRHLLLRLTLPLAPRRFLAELEMKLHLSTEDVGLYLQDHAARAQQRIPAAAKELLRIKVGACRVPLCVCVWGEMYCGRLGLRCRQGLLRSCMLSCTCIRPPIAPGFGGHPIPVPLALPQEDVAALRASTAAALAQLEDAGGGQAAGVVGQLAELDQVKRRMEDACSTLKVGAGRQDGSSGWRFGGWLSSISHGCMPPLCTHTPRLAAHPPLLPPTHHQCCRRRPGCQRCSNASTTCLPAATCAGWQTRWRGCAAVWRSWETAWQSSEAGAWSLPLSAAPWHSVAVCC